MALVLFSCPCLAASEEPPAFGRPDNFSGMVGSYRVTSQAVPTEVNVEDPLTLTVRVTGKGPKEYWPRRSELRLFPSDVIRQFHVEDLANQDRYLEADNCWEFVWRLRPKSQEVKEIPALELVYYLPRLKKYQTTVAPAIPLKVQPRPQVKIKPEIVAATPLPERFYAWASGPEVLERWRARFVPENFVFPVMLVLPPLICFWWYQCWRRQNHLDGLRRRSHAAHIALDSLQKLGQEGECAPIVAVISEYLRQRFHFPAREPTPSQVAQFFFRLGVARELQQRLADFFDACNAVRFSEEAIPQHLANEARNLIAALEAEPALGRLP